jgi:hypothetical protein
MASSVNVVDRADELPIADAVPVATRARARAARAAARTACLGKFVNDSRRIGMGASCGRVLIGH